MTLLGTIQLVHFLFRRDGVRQVTDKQYMTVGEQQCDVAREHGFQHVFYFNHCKQKVQGKMY